MAQSSVKQCKTPPHRISTLLFEDRQGILLRVSGVDDQWFVQFPSNPDMLAKGLLLDQFVLWMIEIIQTSFTNGNHSGLGSQLTQQLRTPG